MNIRTADAPPVSLEHLVGRCFHDADKRRYGTIVGIKHGVPLMQLAGGRRFLIYPDVLARGWIEYDKSPNNQTQTQA